MVRALCRQCGISDKGSKVDCVVRLREKMSCRSTYDKVFSKIWGASGDLGVIIYIITNNNVYFYMCIMYRWLAFCILPP